VWKRTSNPSVAIAILTTLKQHLRYSGTQEDSLIELYADTAFARIEDQTNLQLLTATFEAAFDQFPLCATTPLFLHGVPLQSVQSITFMDVDTYTCTWDSEEYEAITNSVPGYVRPKIGYEWPTAVARNVKVSYTSGYGSTWASLPKRVQHAVLLLTEHYFDQRAAINVGNIVTEIPEGIESILNGLTVGDEFIPVA
jgi:uncharacterized phiE125 gp8 family phage protein